MYYSPRCPHLVFYQESSQCLRNIQYWSGDSSCFQCLSPINLLPLHNGNCLTWQGQLLDKGINIWWNDGCLSFCPLHCAVCPPLLFARQCQYYYFHFHFHFPTLRFTFILLLLSLSVWFSLSNVWIHFPESHQSLTHSVSNSTSRASCDTENTQAPSPRPPPCPSPYFTNHTFCGTPGTFLSQLYLIMVCNMYT